MNSETMNPKRLVKLEKAYNFRDLGGYSTSLGKTTKWGLIYRSDSLENLSAGDLETLAGLNIKTYIDFRSAKEKEKGLDKWACTVSSCVELAIEAGNMISLQAIKDGNARQVMIDVNKSLVRDAQPYYVKFFELLQNAENTPLVFHCTAGKDRAGLAAALYLSALAVPRETIFEDFVLSAKYIVGKYGETAKAKPLIAPVLTVERPYLEAAFEVIDNEYGGVEAFLQNQLKVDLKLMQRVYTV